MTTTTPTFTEEYRDRDDKSRWGDGPWQDEPDKVVWIDATGLDAMAVRNRYGAWCGYVGVPEGHPSFGREYDEVDVDAHGSLTFASLCQPEENDPAGSICHIAQPGRPDRVYWFGFDCGHFMDLSPGGANFMREMAETFVDHDWMQPTYKTLGYVISEVGHLAKQLAAQ